MTLFIENCTSSVMLLRVAGAAEQRDSHMQITLEVHHWTICQAVPLFCLEPGQPGLPGVPGLYQTAKLRGIRDAEFMPES